MIRFQGQLRAAGGYQGFHDFFEVDLNFNITNRILFSLNFLHFILSGHLLLVDTYIKVVDLTTRFSCWKGNMF